MKDQHSIISEGIVVTGNIEAAEDMIVCGKVDGEIASSRTVLIEQGGIVKGQIRAETVVIHGTMVGDVRTHTITQLSKVGRMVGNIFSPQVLLEDGGSFRGKIDMGKAASAAGTDDRMGSTSNLSRGTSRSSSPWGSSSPSVTPQRKASEESAVVSISEDESATDETSSQKKAAKKLG